MMTIWCQTEFESLHCWPEAPDECIYLRHPHRHIFKVKLEIVVTDKNREVEFISLGRELKYFCEEQWPLTYRTSPPHVNWHSCEMMAVEISKWAADKKYIVHSVTVSEDGENGATWYRDWYRRYIMTDEQIEYMVNRFLQWRLPENFNPDGGISFKRYFNEQTDHPMKSEPIGTNLFDYMQAKDMVRFMVEDMPKD